MIRILRSTASQRVNHHINWNPESEPPYQLERGSKSTLTWGTSEYGVRDRRPPWLRPNESWPHPRPGLEGTSEICRRLATEGNETGARPCEEDL
jgi:hypothetical protein